MSATPTRTPSARISRRTSSRSVNSTSEDQPSTSTPSTSTSSLMPPPVAMETDDDVGGAKEANRNILVLANAPIRPDDHEERAAAAARIRPVEEQIERIEKLVLGTSLEEVLKIPKHAVLSDLIPPPAPPTEEEQPGPSRPKTMHPIEVKIEEGDAPSTSVMPSTSGFGESNVERAAKREAHVLARIAELRKTGLWSNSRLPKCVEPERNKTHYDYLLEEVKWMAVDFRTETNNKKRQAKLLAHTIAKLHRDKQIEVARAAEREIKEKNSDSDDNELSIAKAEKSQKKDEVLKEVDALQDEANAEYDDFLFTLPPEYLKNYGITLEDLEAMKQQKEADREEKEQVISRISHLRRNGLWTEIPHSRQVKKLKDWTHWDYVLAEMKSKVADFRRVNKEKKRDARILAYEIFKLQKRKQHILQKISRDKIKFLKMNASKTAKMVAEFWKTSRRFIEPYLTTYENQLVIFRATGSFQSSRFNTTQSVSETNNHGDGRGALSNINFTKLYGCDEVEKVKELKKLADAAREAQNSETPDITHPIRIMASMLDEKQLGILKRLVNLRRSKLNGIVADISDRDTKIMTISLIAHLACSESIWGPHLIVVPTSVILNWEMEFKKWCPALKILTYFGTAKERAEKRKNWQKPFSFHVCIASSLDVALDLIHFSARVWASISLNASKIEDWRPQWLEATSTIRSLQKLILISHPFENSSKELIRFFKILMPALVIERRSQESFEALLKMRKSITLESGSERTEEYGTDVEDSVFIFDRITDHLSFVNAKIIQVRLTEILPIRRFAVRLMSKEYDVQFWNKIKTFSESEFCENVAIRNVSDLFISNLRRRDDVSLLKRVQQLGHGEKYGPQPQAQRIQYVPQGGGRGTYANTMVVNRGGGPQRVMRPAGAVPNGNRVYLERQYPIVVPVRVLSAGQQPQQRMNMGARRQPQVPGTVAAMVLPQRPAGGGPAIRTMHFSRRAGNNYSGGPQQRINVMVQPQNMRAGGPQGGGPMMGGPGPIVVAPPQRLQAGGGNGGPPMPHMQRQIQMHPQAPPNLPAPLPPPPMPVSPLPAGQQPQQRMNMGARRQPPVPGTVAAMVLPQRPAGGGPAIRTMQRAGNNYPGGPQQRINVMVQPQNMRAGGPQGGGPMMGGPGPIRRPMVAGRPIQRIDNQGPPVAQVVVAPPQGLQAGGGNGGPPMLHMQRQIQMHPQAPPNLPAPLPPPPIPAPPPSSSSQQAPGDQGPSGGGPSKL